MEPTLSISSLSDFTNLPPLKTKPTTQEVNWTRYPQKDFLRYEVYRGTSSNVTNENGVLVTEITDQNTLSYLDVGLSPNTNYYYKIYVVAVSGEYVDWQDISSNAPTKPIIDGYNAGDRIVTYHGDETWEYLGTVENSVQKVSGANHTVFLMNDGTVRTVGLNDYGQLGDGTTVDKSTPVDIGLTGVQGVATGYYHTVFLMQDGTVRTVGLNNYGQLGDGTTVDKSTPVDIGLTGVQGVAAGNYHTVFLMDDGTVRTVGYNLYGQLGDGTTAQKETPVDIGLTGVQGVAAGTYHTVFLLTDGTVRTVGRNDYGQLGDGTTADKSTPVDIGLTGVQGVAGGANHTVFLLTDGTVRTVGQNTYGQLGDGTTAGKSTPVDIGLTGVQGVAAGAYYTAFLMNDGTVRTVGRNDYGQLGDGTTADKSTPVDIGLTGVQSVAAGYFHTVFLMQDGTVRTVGYNLYGQLGDGTTVDKSTPVDIGLKEFINNWSRKESGGSPINFPTNGTAPLESAVSNNLAFGGHFGDNIPVNETWELTDTGWVQLTPTTNPPARVGHEFAGDIVFGGFDGTNYLGDTWRWTGTDWVSVSTTTSPPARRDFAMVEADDGAIYLYGGEAADGSLLNDFWKFDGDWVEVSADAGLPGISEPTRTVGYNLYGQLGDGTTVDKSTPVDIGLTGVQGVAAGNNHIVFLMQDGTVKTVGRNNYGQLGDGTTTDKSTPVDIGLTGVQGVAAGAYHTVFLMQDGTVRTVGRNNYGQLGDGTTVNKSTLVDIGLTGVQGVAAGVYHTVFLMTDGTVRTVGQNNGQLGDGTTVDKSTPVDIGLTGVQGVAGGYYHTIFLMQDGTVRAVGWNNYGQLGDGTTVDKSTPVDIGLTGVQDAAAGFYHTVFLLTDGTVRTVGQNTYGQLGDGTTVDKSTPVDIGLTGVQGVAAGYYHTVFLGLNINGRRNPILSPNLFVFGGQTEGTYHGDTYNLTDFTEQTFTTTPDPRAGGLLTKFGQDLILIGGHNAAELSDVWRLNYAGDAYNPSNEELSQTTSYGFAKYRRRHGEIARHYDNIIKSTAPDTFFDAEPQLIVNDTQRALMHFNTDYFKAGVIDKATLRLNSEGGTVAPSEDLIPTMTSNTSPEGVVSASNVFGSGYEAWRAFNDSIEGVNSAWGSDSTADWISYEFSSPTIISGYSLSPRNYVATATLEGMPKDWTFEGWDGTQWIVLDTRSGITNWETGIKKTFNFNNETYYIKYRLNIASINGHTGVILGELEMFGPATSTLEIAPITSEWYQTATWNGMPGTGTPITIDVDPTTTGYVELDITDIVKSWNSGTPNRGIMIKKADETDTNEYVFSSMEATSGLPEFEIDYLLEGIASDDTEVDYDFYTAPENVIVRTKEVGTVLGGTSKVFELELINTNTLGTVQTELSFDGTNPDDTIELSTVTPFSPVATPYDIGPMASGEKRTVYVRVSPGNASVGDRTFYLKVAAKVSN